MALRAVLEGNVGHSFWCLCQQVVKLDNVTVGWKLQDDRAVLLGIYRGDPDPIKGEPFDGFDGVLRIQRFSGKVENCNRRPGPGLGFLANTLGFGLGSESFIVVLGIGMVRG